MDTQRKCRICGCIDDDCRQCIQKTGHPCYWVEEDLCSACQDITKETINKSDMEFFQKLAQTGNVDITLRIMQKEGRLIINVMPGTGSATIPPIIVSGMPAEIDEQFFSAIAPGLDEIKGLVTNLSEVKDELKAKAAEKQAAKSQPEKKKETPKKKSKAPETKEVGMFDAPEEETNDAEESGENDNEEESSAE